MNTSAKEVIEKYCSFMPVRNLCQQGRSRTEVQIIKPEEKLDSDEVVEEFEDEVKTPAKDGEPEKTEEGQKAPYQETSGY